MAYRPTNDIKENVIHRNTIFDAQGMVSCCTCGYCIKKTEDATLTLTNFKAAPPIINEQSIGSGVLEFSDYMIPNGSSGNYILSPQSIQQNLNIESLSDGFIYYPFLNCKGTTSVPLNDGAWGISVLENGFFTRPVKTYGVEVQSSYNQFNPGGFFPRTLNNTFGGTTYYARTFGNQFIATDIPTPNNYSWVSVKSGLPPYPIPLCTQVEIDDYASNYYVNTSPVYPPPTNSGSLENYFSYINNNDWSLEGFRTNASCSNNVVSLMAPAYFLDVSSYQFSYQYPNYTFYSSEKYIYSGPSPVGEPVPPSVYPYNPFWGYDSTSKKMFDIYKGGYVLKDFTIDKFGKFSSSLTMLPIYKLQYKEITYNMFNNPLALDAEIRSNNPLNYYQCLCTENRWTLDPDGTTEKIVDGYSSIGSASAYGGVVSSIYGNNQELIDYRMNGRFNQLSYVNNNWPYNPIYPEEVSFGVNKTPNPFTDPVTYSEAMDQPYVPIKYTASKTDRTQITSTTDATGRTTLTIRNILWSGKILLKNSYSHNLGVNAPRLANGRFIPQAYQAVLKGGFESDAIISFQSIPLCSMVNIADKLRNVTELKVNLENYRKIPQTYMANYHAALQLYYATPAVSEIFQTYNKWAQFIWYLGFPAFTGAAYSSYYVGNGFYIYGAYYFEFNNTEFYPPNVNSENQFRVRNKFTVPNPLANNGNVYDFNVIQKDIVAIDPPVLTSYVAKPGRAYPDFGVLDRFKSCLLINGDPDVWKTGNEVQFVGLDYLVTNGGSGYTSVPTVTLSNGGGTGASAYATISGGKVVSVTAYNKGKDYTSNKTVVISGGGGNGATAVDITFTPFYSIYMEEIKDEKQTAGQTLIRIARTLQDANNGIYIPNVGLETLYKDRSLSVKFLYGWKDISKDNLPRYQNVNLNDPVASNVNADILGGYYSKEAQWRTDFNGTLEFSFSNYSGLNISFKDKNTYAYIQKYNYSSFRTGGNFFNEQGQSFLEVISLSPLKIKYRNLTFDGYGGDYGYYNSLTNPGFQINDRNPQNIPKINVTAMLPFSSVFDSFIGLSMPGFQCDIVMEEVVDEFIQEALPVEFNQILQNVEFIQTSNLMNSRTPMQMINPEQCEHIGKVIDRKDCNCPKKWVRLCDVHGKTDWKKCMQCKDFKVSE